ncbi:hypothetical protein ACFO3J_31790 [Streptomyces polygonati]|uniref:Uncharacterized protein n=1 Tax=Streptomyces polygonati TaxID=1617087 RepID=A0ABV8HVG4_9ACTN
MSEPTGTGGQPYAARPADAAAGTPALAPVGTPADPSGAADAPAPGPAEPLPLGVVVGATGNAEVDTAVVRLGDADELPTQAHIEVYEDVHRGLRDALTALDENRG